MKFTINNEDYDVIIEKKKTTKNIYIRVKEDLKIYVTCNKLTPTTAITTLLEQSKPQLTNMIHRQQSRKQYEDAFYYLGKKYDKIYTEFCDIQLGQGKVFLRKNFDLEKWKKKQALAIFQEHLDTCYQHFSRPIPYPTLRIRTMKTRWGVCNTKTKTITLNTELITKDLKCLDYVIYHELSHLVEANHSKRFWQVVEENCKDYKHLRKMTNQLGEEE